MQKKDATEQCLVIHKKITSAEVGPLVGSEGLLKNGELHEDFALYPHRTAIFIRWLEHEFCSNHEICMVWERRFHRATHRRMGAIP